MCIVVVTCNYSTCWLFNLLLNVKFNDISVIYVTAHKCAGGLNEKVTVGSQRHRHFVRFFKVSDRPRPCCQSSNDWSPSMAQWDLNSQSTCINGPYAGSLDRKFNDQMHVHCANGFKPLVTFYDVHRYTEDLFFLYPESRRRYNYKQNSEYYYATFKTTISHFEFKYILNELVSNSVFVTILIKIPLTTFTCIITLNLITFSECGYSYHPSKLIIRSLISVFIRPTCRDVLWYGVGVCLSVRPSVCPSVHKACRHDTDWTVWARTVKLGTHTTYDKRTNPIDFQGQGSKVKVTR